MEYENEMIENEEGCKTPTRDENNQIRLNLSCPPPPPKKKRPYGGGGGGGGGGGAKTQPPKDGYYQPPDLDLLFVTQSLSSS
ncbi:hypothetical protein MKW94_017046 [Papaver nudicaule]|uniref:Uncharacterized protein n=1 Tax=Papaver nudicaule TaxID=74823 RepID=A0AA41VTC8_PAPNU|nr:hypothetical protein [Papaver nudicaule]